MREQAPPDANTRSPDAGSADFPVVRGVRTPRVTPAKPSNQHQRSEHSPRGGPPCERNHARENRICTRAFHLAAAAEGSSQNKGAKRQSHGGGARLAPSRAQRDVNPFPLAREREKKIFLTSLFLLETPIL